MENVDKICLILTKFAKRRLVYFEPKTDKEKSRYGVCTSSKIYLNCSLKEYDKLLTCVHETAHAKLRHTEFDFISRVKEMLDLSGSRLDRAIALTIIRENEANLVTELVMNKLGLRPPLFSLIKTKQRNDHRFIRDLLRYDLNRDWRKLRMSMVKDIANRITVFGRLYL